MNQAKTEHLPKTLIVGLGSTGLSVLRHLRARGETVAVTDSRAAPPGLAEMRESHADVPAALGGFDADFFAAADRLVVSPGVSLEEPLIRQARARGAEIVGDIELFARAARAPVVAITGSNGKSTVTTLLGEMARKAGLRVPVGGNIGRPALDLLDEGPVDFYLLELSSFQLDTTESLDAAAAVVLNLSADHMDRYAALERYAASKQRVYRGHGLMLINRDDSAVLAMRETARRSLSFGLDRPPSEADYGLLEVAGETWLGRGEQRLLPVRELAMAGTHNRANALAALALGEAMGLPLPAMLETLRRFGGLRHRTQWVAETAGVRWYNDSKGTNVGATLAAIEGLTGPLVLIAGGQGKGADFSPLRPALAAKGRAVVLLGEAAETLEAALGGVLPVRRVRDMAQAVEVAAELAQPGDAVLLSPACASFDMFEGFAARGEAFMRAVQAREAER